MRSSVALAEGDELGETPLGPALSEVADAAVAMRQAESIGVRAVRGPHVIIEAALDLVNPSVILIGPHVVRQRGGKSVSGDLLRTIAERGIAEDRKERLR